MNKVNGTLTQIVASGDSEVIDVSDAYSAVVSLSHVNGTGTITTGAEVQPQISHDGTNFVDDGGAFTFSDVAEAAEARTYIPPTDGFAIKAIRFAYLSPDGSTGHTLDVSFSKTVSLFS